MHPPVVESIKLPDKKADEISIDTLISYPPLQVEDLAPILPDSPLFYDPYQWEPNRYTLKPLKIATVLSLEEAVLVQKAGFRVQVIAVNDQDRARNIEARVRELLEPVETIKEDSIQIEQSDEPEQSTHIVYLVYDAPQYKVRVGDFLLREDALQLSNRLRQSGYYDVWVVPSKVMVREKK